jgi:hypothetical protein
MNSAPPPRPDRRWLDWQPTDSITADSTGSEPTEPTKLGSVGFEGSLSTEVAKIDPATNMPVRVGLDSVSDSERPLSWADWKAGALKQLFLEQGKAGTAGRITAETIRHGQSRSMMGLTDKYRDAQTLERINS